MCLKCGESTEFELRGYETFSKTKSGFLEGNDNQTVSIPVCVCRCGVLGGSVPSGADIVMSGWSSFY